MAVFAEMIPTQKIYRTLLQAMSHPGRVYNMEFPDWDTQVEAVCETLLDHEVSFCAVAGDADLEPRAEALEEKIFSVTKARRRSVEQADYIFVVGPYSRGEIYKAKTGTPEFPDRGATMIYLSEQIMAETKRGVPFLSGPGLDREKQPEINPLMPEEWQALREVNSEYPLGVDIICLCSNSRVICVPRSTRIRIG